APHRAVLEQRAGVGVRRHDLPDTADAEHHHGPGRARLYRRVIADAVTALAPAARGAVRQAGTGVPPARGYLGHSGQARHRRRGRRGMLAEWFRVVRDIGAPAAHGSVAAHRAGVAHASATAHIEGGTAGNVGDAVDLDAHRARSRYQRAVTE